MFSRATAALRRGDGTGPLLIIATALWRLLPQLSHPGIHDWDEAIHLAVARGLMNTPLTPHVLPVLFHPVNPHEWVGAGVWLHKPPGSMWLSALSMSIFGVGTGAARLPSLLAMTGAALSVYALLRPVTNRIFATVSGMALLSLPFTLELVHGYMFGDLTDTTLTGCVAGAVALLVYGAKKDSLPACAFAGFLVGYGYLCKSALALTPVGVAFGLAALHLIKLAPGMRPTRFLLFVAVAAVVAYPWTYYASHQWPELWAIEAEVVRQHLTEAGARSNHAIAQWVRPLDAIFNEIHGRTLAPFPRALPLLAGLWILYSALRTRELERLAVAAWLWATWIVLSLAAAKVPATAWGAVAATFFAMGVLFHDGMKRPALAGAALGALASDALGGIAPQWLISWLPARFEQSRDGKLLDGLLLAIAGAVVALILARAGRRRTQRVATFIGLCSCAVAAACALPGGFIAQNKLMEAQSVSGFTAHVKDAGLSLAKVAPANSAVLLNIDRSPPAQFLGHDALFWTGRALVGTKEDLELAGSRGMGRYLLSPLAEPYAPVDVPAGAWLRAYDVSVPAPPPPIPSGALKLDVAYGEQRLVGVASVKTPFDSDRWAFFVEPHGAPTAVTLTFELDDGESRDVSLAPEQCLKSREALVNVPWFVLPALGPPTEKVVALRFKHTGQRVPLR